MKSFKSLKIAAALGAMVLLIPALTSAASISFTTPSVIKAGLGVVTSTIQSLMIKGSFLARGQFVCDSIANPNCGLVYGVKGYDVPSYAKDTGSGGLAKYDTIIARCPFNASTAAARGLKTGTGVGFYTQLDIIANPANASLDCSVVSGPNTGTGGTAIISNASGTGTIATSTTPFTCGPTQYVKCGTTTVPTASFSGSLLFKSVYSDVTN